MLGRRIVIVPRGGRWTIEVDGRLQQKRYLTREAAIERARDIADDEDIELFIRLPDGQMLRLDDGVPPVVGDEGAPTYWK